MSEPEIARRCPACGVSLRQHAVYCPQCGERIGEPETVETSQTAPTQTLNPNQPSSQATLTGRKQVLNPTPPSSGATGVAGNVRERVEKIRHVSSVMIDQAAYDPSLRFLLVAGALFVVFLILLLLSKVIG